MTSKFFSFFEVFYGCLGIVFVQALVVLLIPVENIGGEITRYIIQFSGGMIAFIICIVIVRKFINER